MDTAAGELLQAQERVTAVAAAAQQLDAALHGVQQLEKERRAAEAAQQRAAAAARQVEMDQLRYRHGAGARLQCIST